MSAIVLFGMGAGVGALVLSAIWRRLKTNAIVR